MQITFNRLATAIVLTATLISGASIAQETATKQDKAADKVQEASDDKKN